MTITEPFFVAPNDVLTDALDERLQSVAVVGISADGTIQVWGSHSTPITLALLKAAPLRIDAMTEVEAA